MYKRSELFFNILLVPIDFLMVVAAFLSAYLIRTRIVHAPIAFHPGASGYLKLLLIVAPVWIAIFAALGLYSFHSNRGRFAELGRVTVAVSAGVMVMIVWDYAAQESIFPSRSIPIYALILGALFVSLGRLAIWSLQHALFRQGVGVHRVLLVGRHRNAEILAAQLNLSSGEEIIGILDDNTKSGVKRAGLETLGRISEIEQVFSRRHVDELIVTDPGLDEAVIYSLIAYADARKISFRYAPTLFGIYNVNTEVSQLAGVPLIALRKTSLEGWGRIEKRLLDLVVSSLGLIALSPFFLLMAILIKATDPGPVFYRHRRVGRGGSEIMVLKFRTMKAEFSTGKGYSGKTDQQIFKQLYGTEKGEELYQEFKKNQKLVDDPRVSGVGGFLRRTSLDELPQLWNVLRGQMTLVGPRPVTEGELDKYGQYRHMVLSLKPGMTGLWQVSGRSDVSYEERVRLDTYYVENWSLWLDVQTILRTLKVLIRRSGAY